MFMKNGPEKQKLFDGLWVAKNCPTLLTKELPVLSLDFSGLSLAKGGTAFEESLFAKLKSIAKANQVTVSENQLPNFVESLVSGLAQKTKENKVVLLIDEYDAPVTRVLTLGDGNKKAIENRGVLRGFFATLKSLDAYTHFQMVTGVSRFARTSLFSGGNQLNDISFDPVFSSLLGYTKSEIQAAFGPHLEALARKDGTDPDKLWEKITSWYNGYSWGGGEKVYNPYSIGMLFNKMYWEGFWTNAGTPSWLLRLLKPEDLEVLPRELNQWHSMNAFVKFELESLGRTFFDTVSLLFQTGYLTIKEERQDAMGERMISLDYPNYEVRKHVLSEAFKEILQVNFDYAHLEKLRKALDENDVIEFYKLLDNYFRSVPYTIYKKESALTTIEGFYTSLLAFALQFLPEGYSVQPEDPTSDGSADIVIKTPTRIFVVEHKVLKDNTKKEDRQSLLDKLAQEALEQIDQKCYAAKFSLKDKPITKVGVCFDAGTRGVGKVKFE